MQFVTYKAEFETQLLSLDSSSGNDSDREEKTPKEKASRTRAKVVTDKRKKVSLKPYVININAYSKPNCGR